MSTSQDFHKVRNSCLDADSSCPFERCRVRLTSRRVQYLGKQSALTYHGSTRNSQCERLPKPRFLPKMHFLSQLWGPLERHGLSIGSRNDIHDVKPLGATIFVLHNNRRLAIASARGGRKWDFRQTSFLGPAGPLWALTSGVHRDPQNPYGHYRCTVDTKPRRAKASAVEPGEGWPKNLRSGPI